MKKIVFGAVLSAAVFGASAQAYLGVGVGATHTSVQCGDVVSCKTSDSGFKVYGGYAFMPKLAVEMGYIHFGKADILLFRDQFLGQEYTGRTRYEATAFTLALAARLPFTAQLSGVVRLGAANVKTAWHYAEAVPAYQLSYNEDAEETKLSPYVGLGVAYAFTKHIKAELSADFTKGQVKDESGSLRMLGAALQFDF